MPISQLGSADLQTASLPSAFEALNADDSDLAQISQEISESAYKVELSYQALNMALETQKQMATLVTG